MTTVPTYQLGLVVTSTTAVVTKNCDVQSLNVRSETLKCPNYRYALLLGGRIRAFRLVQSTAGLSNCTVSMFLIPLHQNSTQTNTTHVHVNEEWEWKLLKPQDRCRHQFALEEIDSIFTVLCPHKSSIGSHKCKKRFSMSCIFMNEWPVVTCQARELSHLPSVYWSNKINHCLHLLLAR